MAVGEGGFSIKPMGFDKSEVNEYISNIRKRINEMEAEKKVNDEKTKAAVKTAEEAENRIKAAEQRGTQKIAELEAQVKTERRNAESLTIQIDELKRKLKQKAPAASAAAGGASTAAAEKQSAEIISKANKTARDIVEKAKKSAEQIMASAQSAAQGAAAAQNNAALEDFMSVLKNYLETVNSGFNAVNQKASELLGAPAPSAPAVMPDFSSFTAPRAEVPVPSAEPVSLGGIFDNMDDSSDDMEPSGFSFDDIAPINPDTPKAEPVDSFDLSHVHQPAVDEPVDDIAPLDTDTAPKTALDNDFMADLIAQTVPSAALSDELDGDMLAAVQAQDEKFAVQPADADKGVDFDMDMGGSGSADDPMAALLAQAQAAFGGGGSSMEISEPEPEPEAASANPWEDLQKQLEAMEQSGNLGGMDMGGSSEPSKDIAEDPKAPSADDSAIWNFGDGGDSSSDDDDDDMMSSDLFGSF